MFKKILFCLLSFLCLYSTVNAEELVKYAKSAILIEPTTNKIVYENNSREQMAPASMTKMMTMLLIMEAYDNGQFKLDDMVPISKNSSSMGGSQLFLQENTEIKAEELIKGIAIASGNDAAVAMAEFIAGTTDEFVKMMNDKVIELGLTDTHFVNVHGLDDPNHYSSAYDMAQIARELLKHPKILEYTSLYEDYLVKPDGSKIWLVNTNKLVRFYEGVDGLKTGYTSSAKYCLTATGIKNNIRFISVVMGVDTGEHRSYDTTTLLNYGFNTYKINNIVKKDDIVDEVKVHKGVKSKIPMIVSEDVNDLVKKNEVKEYSYKVNKLDVKAPINKGDIIGSLEVLDNDGKTVRKIDLVSNVMVKKQSFLSLFKKFFFKYIRGY